jgi:hypothetical protein
MHGRTSTPERQVRLSRMAALTEQGAVVVFPQVCHGARHTWPGTRLPLGLRLFLGKVSYVIWRALDGT